MPKITYARFRTCVDGSLTPAIGGGVKNDTLMIVKGNSPYQPFNEANAVLTATDVPPDLASWAGFYDRLMVNRSFLNFRWRSADTVDRMIAVIPLRTNTPLANTLRWKDICDYPRIVYKPLGGTDDSWGGYRNVVTTKYTATTKSMYEKKSLSTESGSFTATFTGDPTKEWWYHVLIMNVAGSDISATALEFFGNVTHYTRMDRRDQIPS